jgi:acyl carrier protein
LNNEVIIKELNNIFKDILENEHLEISGNTTASEVENWDSLNHLILMMQIEKSFNIKFTAEEIQSFDNISSLVNKIKEKKNV